MAPTNGTSVQLLRLLAGIEHLAVHLLWDIREAGTASVPQSIVLDDTWNSVDKTNSLPAGAKWWTGNHVDKARLREALQAFPAQPTRAWIFCGNERDATRAAAILAALDDPPFLLHLMDIFHNQLSPAQTPHLLALIERANQVVCTSAAAAEEVRKQRATETHVLPCCSNFTAEHRSSSGKPFRIALTGALWDKSMWNTSPALDLFAAAWPQIKERIDGVELHYAGGFGEHLPSSIASDVCNHGYLQPADCEQLLRTCHLGYLPVSLNTRFGPYSVPSRLADYLACGLPTITCTSPGTGIYAFIQATPRGTAVNVTDSDELVKVIAHLASDPAEWKRLSTEAASYARKVLHADAIRSQLLEYLDHCDDDRSRAAPVE
ncbi:MAG: glycosyltransferase [Chthoniobacterales bacterium]